MKGIPQLVKSQLDSLLGGSTFEAHSAIFQVRGLSLHTVKEVQSCGRTWRWWLGRDYNSDPLTLLPTPLSLAGVPCSELGCLGKLLSPRVWLMPGLPGFHPRLCACLSELVAVCSMCTKPLILRLKTVAEGLL